jgi:probable F420-dependent oxidoreductase
MTDDLAANRLPQLSLYLTTFSAQDPGGWQHVFDRARAAEAAGFDRLVVPDHVVFGERLEEYGRPEVGGAAGGQQPTGPDGYWLEPLTVLSVLAGITTRVRLGTNILIASLRRPVVLAKTLSTLDVLSNGRVDLGVGVGWQREEYEAAGLEFEGRGRLLDHTLEVCQTLWHEQRAAFDSPLLRFENIHMMPKPLQPGGVPIWVSGTVNKNVIRRVARFGSGWIPWGPARVDVKTGIAQMREGLAELGRDPSTLDIVGVIPMVEDQRGAVDLARTMEPVPDLVAAGVTDFRFNTNIPDGASAATDFLTAMAEAFRAAR